MNRMLLIVLLCALLCGCAAAGPAPQMGLPTEPSTQAPSQSIQIPVPSNTVQKNPGLELNPYDPEDKVPDLTELRIRKDYCAIFVNLTPDQVKLRFMGIFGESYVLFVDVKDMMYAEVITTDTVAGLQFVYSCSQRMQVWSDGQFYNLQLAYDNGLLTREDLRTLARDYYDAYPHLWQYISVPE